MKTVCFMVQCAKTCTSTSFYPQHNSLAPTSQFLTFLLYVNIKHNTKQSEHLHRKVLFLLSHSNWSVKYVIKTNTIYRGPLNRQFPNCIWKSNVCNFARSVLYILPFHEIKSKGYIQQHYLFSHQ